MFHGGEQKRKNDIGRSPDSLRQRCLFTHFNPSGFLRVPNSRKVGLDIRDVPQGDGDRIGNGIRKPYHVEGSGKFGRICGHQEDKDRRNDRKVLNKYVEEVKKFLSGKRMTGQEGGKNRLATVNRSSLIRRKHKNSKKIQHHKNHDKGKDRPYLLPGCSGKDIQHQTDAYHDQKYPRVIGQGTGQTPQKKKYQFGDTGQAVKGRVFFFIT